MYINWAVMKTEALNWKKDKKHRCNIALRDTHTSLYPCHCLSSTLFIRLVIYICDKTFSHAPFKRTPAPLGIISAEGSSQFTAAPVSPFFHVSALIANHLLFYFSSQIEVIAADLIKRGTMYLTLPNSDCTLRENCTLEWHRRPEARRRGYR